MQFPRRFPIARGLAERRKPGQMNGTEQRYAAQLEGKKLLGEVVEFWYEGVKLRLADNTFYSPDFLVMVHGGELECHEVKGGKAKTAKDGTQYAAAYSMEDSRIKIKVAAQQYPFRFLIAFEAPKKLGGGWRTEEI